ncbi:MAG: hypothetical protein J4O13_08950 [Chloroflexi bacterium]|nr:hypothetical protein [Chloroflexota bacterium]MCI0784002.1 hypothetical protein [Chloroflexota bacterium]MCI0819379.1 hypothetical protein [Chloroflexota bacterium]MCI0831620.1 hypothetical protein [Chloroflexota bacterium]MCI0884499.1 hypothetical protein [Chloroflexota bacterium]
MQQSLSGWVTFAAIIVVIAGMFNLLSGIAAITETDQVKALNQVLYGINIEAWGWFWAAIGVAQLITAILLFARNPTGAMLAILGATISATFTIFLIFVAPLWAITVVALNIGIIWAITANIEDFEADRT